MIGIVFVCDVCLEELLVSQGDFDPIDISEMADKASQAKGWYIPDLVGYNEELDRYFEIPASNIRSFCPKHIDQSKVLLFHNLSLFLQEVLLLHL